MLKRYLLFTAPDYEQLGGWGDFSSSHDTPEEAVSAWMDYINNEEKKFGEPDALAIGDRWMEVIDKENGHLVENYIITAFKDGVEIKDSLKNKVVEMRPYKHNNKNI